MAASIPSGSVEPELTNLEQGADSSSALKSIIETLDDLKTLDAHIVCLKKETLEKETEVLKAILEKIAPLVPLLSEDCEAYHRHEIVLINKIERADLEEIFGFYSEHKLILYENGLLVDAHRYGETSTRGKSGWEITDETILAPMAAITTFGLNAITEGLIKILSEVPSIIILKEELESRLAALTKVLEAVL